MTKTFRTSQTVRNIQIEIWVCALVEARGTLSSLLLPTCRGLTRTHASFLKARIKLGKLVGPVHLKVPPASDRLALDVCLLPCDIKREQAGICEPPRSVALMKIFEEGGKFLNEQLAISLSRNLGDVVAGLNSEWGSRPPGTGA